MNELNQKIALDLSEELGTLQSIKNDKEDPVREKEILLELQSLGLIKKDTNFWIWVKSDPKTKIARDKYWYQLTS